MKIRPVPCLPYFAFEQVESVCPVSGSVEVQNDTGYCVASQALTNAPCACRAVSAGDVRHCVLSGFTGSRRFEGRRAEKESLVIRSEEVRLRSGALNSSLLLGWARPVHFCQAAKVLEVSLT